MQLNYDLLTDFELPLAPGPGRGRFQTPAKAPTLKYFLTKEIVGRASGYFFYFLAQRGGSNGAGPELWR